MGRFDVETVINIVNLIALVLFIVLLALAVVRMGIRIVAYRWAGRTAHVLMRRDFGLLSALFIVFGGNAVIRFFNWEPLLDSHSPGRLAYILFQSFVSLGALGYWTWVEWYIVGHPGKEED